MRPEKTATAAPALLERIPIGEHGPFLLAVVAGATLRVLVAVTYQPALLLQRDAYSYLLTAYGAPSRFRPELYPLLLKPLLIGRQLAVVPSVQHLLALGLAVLLYALLRRLGIGPVMATVALLPLLLDPYQVDLEQYVLSETFFEVFAVSAFVILLWRTTVTPSRAALAGALIAAAILTRYVGAILIPVVIVYALTARLGWKSAGAVIAGALVVIGGYAGWHATNSGGGGSGGKLGYFLYGRVASFADCTRVHVPPSQKPLCIDVPPAARGPDYGFRGLDRYIKPIENQPNANGLLTSFSLSMIRHQPFEYVSAVAGDVGRFFTWTSPPRREPYAQRWVYVLSLAQANPVPIIRARGGAPPPSLHLGTRFRIDAALAGGLRRYQQWIYTYGPLLGVLLALGLIGGVAGWRRDRRVAAAALTLSLAALGLMVFAAMVNVFHFRYEIPALPFAGPAAALGLKLLRPAGGQPSASMTA
ncbi:MAG: hypothetical protein QOF16_204 [Actinomycetota bacterium]|nr:hypothetical protein [Actinomycetota bacterium]